MRCVTLGGLAACLVLAVLPGAALANGATQREIQGRVLSTDVPAGTLVVEQTFRGKTTRLRLVAPPGVRVFSCGGETQRFDQVKAGAPVSVFYEVAGSEGVANMIVIEPGR
ncbi:MAG: hypothetical protein HY726_09540 [Candidatus Rokubacteria bacterium]|nr:hypothetical protein [Candidatus Rokubacteria bacterium]